MAYGNWGAFVYKNGERQTDREDQSPYEEHRDAGYHQAFGLDRGKLGPHHAVLGDGDIRLCGYKCYPRLYKRGEAVELDPFIAARDKDGEAIRYKGDLDGTAFSAELSDNQVHLYLRMQDGTVWTATSGYGMGAGFEDDA